jgi:hypothetical protein
VSIRLHGAFDPVLQGSGELAQGNAAPSDQPVGRRGKDRGAVDYGSGIHLYTKAFEQPKIATPSLVQALPSEAASSVDGSKFSPLFDDRSDIVDVWQLASWDADRDGSRPGRKKLIGGNL